MSNNFCLLYDLNDYSAEQKDHYCDNFSTQLLSSIILECFEVRYLGACAGAKLTGCSLQKGASASPGFQTHTKYFARELAQRCVAHHGPLTSDRPHRVPAMSYKAYQRQMKITNGVFEHKDDTVAVVREEHERWLSRAYELAYQANAEDLKAMGLEPAAAAAEEPPAPVEEEAAVAEPAALAADPAAAAAFQQAARKSKWLDNPMELQSGVPAYTRSPAYHHGGRGCERMDGCHLCRAALAERDEEIARAINDDEPVIANAEPEPEPVPQRKRRRRVRFAAAAAAPQESRVIVPPPAEMPALEPPPPSYEESMSAAFVAGLRAAAPAPAYRPATPVYDLTQDEQ